MGYVGASQEVYNTNVLLAKRVQGNDIGLQMALHVSLVSTWILSLRSFGGRRIHICYKSEPTCRKISLDYGKLLRARLDVHNSYLNISCGIPTYKCPLGCSLNHQVNSIANPQDAPPSENPTLFLFGCIFKQNIYPDFGSYRLCNGLTIVTCKLDAFKYTAGLFAMFS